MKPFPAVSLSLLSIALVMSASSVRADDPVNPPAAPLAPAAQQVSPADGDQPAPTPTPAPRRGRMRPQGYVLEDLTEKLSLTPDQQKSIGALIDNARSQAKTVRGDDSLSQDDKREKMRGIMKATHDQIRAALTPDQQKLFDALPPPGRQRKTETN